VILANPNIVRSLPTILCGRVICIYNHYDAVPFRTNNLRRFTMPRLCWLIPMLALFMTAPCPAQEKFSFVEKEAAPPKEVNAAIAKLLSEKGIQVSDSAGKQFAEVWLRSEIPSDATPDQIKNGITYREVKQGEVLGAIRFEKEWQDYRKQRVPAGVYTFRLGYQPQDGDHMGMGEFQEYALLIAAAGDTGAAPLDAEAMIKMSMKATKTGHPGVMMLVPTPAKGKDTELVSRPRGQWVLAVRRPIVAGGKKTGSNLGIGITVEGHASE